MKKGLLFSLLFVFLFFSSCSDDDSENVMSTSPSVLKVKIDGVLVVFDKITVEEIPYSDGGENFVDVNVTARVTNDASKVLKFNIDQNLIGANEMLVISYELAGSIYNYRFDQVVNDPAYLYSEVLKNTSSRLDGTFSGMVSRENPFSSSGYDQLSIEEGTYSIYY